MDFLWSSHGNLGAQRLSYGGLIISGPKLLLSTFSHLYPSQLLACSSCTLTIISVSKSIFPFLFVDIIKSISYHLKLCHHVTHWICLTVGNPKTFHLQTAENPHTILQSPCFMYLFYFLFPNRIHRSIFCVFHMSKNNA